jgi:hypothetical protein
MKVACHEVPGTGSNTTTRPAGNGVRNYPGGRLAVSCAQVVLQLSKRLGCYHVYKTITPYHSLRVGFAIGRSQALPQGQPFLAPHLRGAQKPKNSYSQLPTHELPI